MSSANTVRVVGNHAAVNRQTRQRQKFPREWTSGVLVTFFRLTSGRAVPTHPSEHAGRSRKSWQAPLRGGHHDDWAPPPTYPRPWSLLWAPLQPQFLHISYITHLSDGRFFSFHKRVVVDRVFLCSSLTLPSPPTPSSIVLSYVLQAREAKPVE